jgi:DNA-directed RNA polymerase subunit RPC12/RpoP
MADMTFQCQVCRTELSAEQSQVGTLVRCPLCKAALRVPAPLQSVVAAGVSPTASYAAPEKKVYVPAHLLPRSGSNKRYGFNCVYCSSRLEATESAAAQQGQCPTCGNTITIPILDRYNRLIDPITKEIIKQDPHPVHAYAAAGERAPQIIRLEDGGQAIECPRCHTLSAIASNNCKSCGMPFTMEGTTIEAGGNANGFCVASLVLGIIGLPTFCFPLVSLLAIIFGVIGYNQANRSNVQSSGKGIAIAGIVCGAIGAMLAAVMYLPKLF